VRFFPSPQLEHRLNPPYIQIKLWNVNTRECLKAYREDSQSPVVSLFYDDKHRTHFWSASLAPLVCLWDLPNGLLLHQFVGT
jgi:WD40 repeat protein